MADLLTNAERLEIRDAIKDVADTFFKTDATIKHFIISTSYFNNGLGKNFIEYPLKCLYEDNSGMTEKDLEGAKSNYGLKLSFLMQDMPSEVLTADNLTIFSDSADYVTVKGREYKIGKIEYDAPLDERDILMIVHCDVLQDKL